MKVYLCLSITMPIFCLHSFVLPRFGALRKKLDCRSEIENIVKAKLSFVLVNIFSAKALDEKWVCIKHSKAGLNAAMISRSSTDSKMLTTLKMAGNACCMETLLILRPENLFAI